jgi:hypothetical protein
VALLSYIHQTVSWKLGCYAGPVDSASWQFIDLLHYLITGIFFCNKAYKICQLVFHVGLFVLQNFPADRVLSANSWLVENHA